MPLTPIRRNAGLPSINGSLAVPEYDEMRAYRMRTQGFEMRSSLVVLAFAVLVGSATAQFQLLVTETPSGSVGPGQWMGVRRYNVAGTGGAATLGNGIATANVSDPAGLAFSASGELFVANRHGNSAASSVSRFLYNSGTDTYTANGTITGNSLFGSHGLNFSATGELFASNVNGPVSRFTFPGGVPTPNGTIGSGPSRDVFLSADGRWAYVTQGVSSQLLKYDLTTGNLVNSFNIGGASGLHNGSWLGNDLYVAGFNSSTISRIQFDANGDVMASSNFSSNAPIALDFSPDGQEMFVASHTGGMITRYGLVSNNWVQQGQITTGIHLGDLIIAGEPVPEPASMAAVAMGIGALLRRRRKQ